MAEEVILEKGWELCCTITDEKDECCKGLQGPNEKGEVWCDDRPDCYKKHEDCGCYVFYRFKQKDAVWYVDANPGYPVPQRDEKKWEQRCFCAKQSKKVNFESRLLRDIGQLLTDLSSEQEAATILPRLAAAGLEHSEKMGSKKAK